MYVECTEPTLRGHAQVLLSAFGREVEDSFDNQNLTSLNRACAHFEAHLAALLELRADSERRSDFRKVCETERCGPGCKSAEPLPNATENQDA